jgi:hypothetical protein
MMPVTSEPAQIEGWVLERYQVTTDEASKIKYDPNAWGWSTATRGTSSTSSGAARGGPSLGAPAVVRL